MSRLLPKELTQKAIVVYNDIYRDEWVYIVTWYICFWGQLNRPRPSVTINETYICNNAVQVYGYDSAKQMMVETLDVMMDEAKKAFSLV